MSDDSRIILPYGQRSAAPLSGRKVRQTVSHNDLALRTLTLAMSSFFRLSLWGRIKWMVLGARAFAPKPDATLRVDVSGNEVTGP